MCIRDRSYTAPDGYVYDLKAVSYKDTDHDYIGWELTDADQSVWSFDKYGILRYVTDVNGFKTVLDLSLIHISVALGISYHLRIRSQRIQTFIN